MVEVGKIISMNYYITCGLILDLFGVLFLGYDLIRLQSAIKKRAKDRRVEFDSIESDYGGIESWTHEIMQQSEWTSSDIYSRYYAEEEVVFNVRNALEGLRNISDAVNGLSSQIIRITKIIRDNIIEDEELAATSNRLSILGLVLLVLGFGIQIYGTSIYAP